MHKADNTGIKALNQDYRRYEQVDKPQRYGLSENDSVDVYDEQASIPVCDMQPFFTGGVTGQHEFAAQLGQAMSEIGFAIIVNHGVPQQLYDDIEQQVLQFFQSTPESARQPYLAQRHGSVNQGYFPVRETSQIHPDLVEGWVFCRRAFNLDEDAQFDARQFWPQPEFEAQFRRLIVAHEALILPLMQSMLRHLGCDPHLYDQRLSASNFGFRLNYYPPLQDGPLQADIDSGGGRMLGHEDVDLFTLLPAPSVEGLQVLNRASGKWIRLEAPPGSLIINTGDYMQRISNDRFASTTHRVARPRSVTANTMPRVSFPMAIYVWEDELLEVLPGLGEPKYPPIRAETFHTRITSKYYGDDYAAG